jgi:hypothetical protein
VHDKPVSHELLAQQLSPGPPHVGASIDASALLPLPSPVAPSGTELTLPQPTKKTEANNQHRMA